MVQADGRVIKFPIDYWQAFEAKRGISPEEKGWIFCEDLGGKVVAIFHDIEATGSAVHVNSSEEYADAVQQFTRMHPVYLIPYHTHPIEGPSEGDLRNYKGLFRYTDGELRDFMTIGPTTIRLDRLFKMENEVKYANLIGTDFLGFVEPLSQKRIARHQKMANEFDQLKRIAYSR